MTPEASAQALRLPTAGVHAERVKFATPLHSVTSAAVAMNTKQH